MTQRVLLFSNDTIFNSIINDLLSDSETFCLQVVENFQLNRDNLKLIEGDIPIFFVSNDTSLDRFQDFLSKKSFKSTFIVFNSSKEDLIKEKTKILSFQIPFNLNQLSQDIAMITQNQQINIDTIESLVFY